MAGISGAKEKPTNESAKKGTYNTFKKQGERARVMQMKNQRFLYPESAAERRQAEDDPLVRFVGVDGNGDGDGYTL